MKLKWFLALIAVFGMAFGTALAQDSEANLQFEEEMFDFGDIDKGEKVTHVFKFKNEGEGPLEIKNVSTSCGCTSAKPEKTVYQPGEAGEIPVTFDSERFSGPITKRVTVTTNEKDNPRRVVTIKGNVITEITSKPVSVFFPQAKINENTQQEILVSTSKLDKLEISNLQVQPEYLTGKVEQVDDKSAKIILTAHGDKFPAARSRLTGSVSYDTNSETQGTIRTTVTISVMQPVRVSPASVYFFASKMGKEREMQITLTSTEGKAFEIQEMTSDIEHIKIENKSGDNKSKTLLVTLTDKMPEGKFRGAITIKTNIPEQSEVTIPVRGSVVK